MSPARECDFAHFPSFNYIVADVYTPSHFHNWQNFNAMAVKESLGIHSFNVGSTSFRTLIRPSTSSIVL